MIDAISNFVLQSATESENVFDMMKRLSGEIDNFLKEIGYPIPPDSDSDEYSD
jgi:hypothetical protein